MTPLTRFNSRVQRGPDCYGWSGSRHSWGYGRFSLAGKSTTAHRAAWMLLVGPIPRGLQVLHHCDNPPCTRIEHLFLGTGRDNAQDAKAKGRLRGQSQERCVHGHPFDEKNTYIRPNGRRDCRACVVDRARRYRDRRVA
jgi:hypothetical protein